MYQIIVTTGNKSFAGTDANVYIQLHGRKGQETPRLPLDDEKNNFEKGQIDVFKVYRRSCQFVTLVKLYSNPYNNSYFLLAYFLDLQTVNQMFNFFSKFQFVKRAELLCQLRVHWLTDSNACLFQRLDVNAVILTVGLHQCV